MATKLILTWEKQQEIRPLPVQFSSKYSVFADEIQTVNLKKLLGIEFYNEIIQNLTSSEEKYTDLLNGCDFSDGKFDYFHIGLRGFLAHLNAAKHTIRGKFHETASGIVIKSNQDAEQISFSAQKQLENEQTEYAMTFFTEIKRFLIVNSAIYPNFGLSNNIKSFYSPKIDKIG